MACSTYEGLVKQWRRIISIPQDDEIAITACWEAAEHQISCEVCRDEELAWFFSRAWNWQLRLTDRICPLSPLIAPVISFLRSNFLPFPVR